MLHREPTRTSFCLAKKPIYLWPYSSLCKPFNFLTYSLRRSALPASRPPPQNSPVMRRISHTLVDCFVVVREIRRANLYRTANARLDDDVCLKTGNRAALRILFFSRSRGKRFIWNQRRLLDKKYAARKQSLKPRAIGNFYWKLLGWFWYHLASKSNNER